MQREPRAFVEDIVVSCDAIAADVQGVDVESYLANRMIRSAVEREFMINGEGINKQGEPQFGFAHYSGAELIHEWKSVLRGGRRYE